jgi:hypothetical protein
VKLKVRQRKTLNYQTVFQMNPFSQIKENAPNNFFDIIQSLIELNLMKGLVLILKAVSFPLDKTQTECVPSYILCEKRVVVAHTLQ